jgi:hypothetical protein
MFMVESPWCDVMIGMFNAIVAVGLFAIDF